MSPSINLDTHIADSSTSSNGKNYPMLFWSAIPMAAWWSLASPMLYPTDQLAGLSRRLCAEGRRGAGGPSAGRKPASGICQRILHWRRSPPRSLVPSPTSRLSSTAPPRRCQSLASPSRSSSRRDRALKKKTYVYCNVPAPTTFTQFYDKLKDDRDWTVHTLPCTHVVQIDMPTQLTELLVQAI